MLDKGKTKGKKKGWSLRRMVNNIIRTKKKKLLRGKRRKIGGKEN